MLMLRKKYLCALSICMFTIFFSLISYFVYSINTTNGISNIVSSTEYNIDVIEHEIKVRAINLPEEYTLKHKINDATLNNFIKNTHFKGTIFNYKNLWNEFDNLINKDQIFNGNNTKIGAVIKALQTAKILSVDNYSKGTQFKLIFQLEVSFKL